MKRLSRLILILLIWMLLGGCGLSVQSVRLEDPGEALQGLTGQKEMQISESGGEAEFYTALYTDGTPAVLWGRDQLSVHAQTAYDLLSSAVAGHQETPVTVDIEEDEVQPVLTALRIDHPEYFWFDGTTSFVTTSVAGVVTKTECTLSYTMALPEIQAAHQHIEQYTAACLSQLSQWGAETDYEKILGVYRYIIETTDYVQSEPDQSIVSAMVNHVATCAGYARSFQYLMNQLGIPCTLALGEGASGEAHGWNMVRCGGSWYQMDVTWGDPVDPDGAPGHTIQYTYCMVTDDEIYRDHTLTSEIRMPVCTETVYNYYVQSGLQLDTWDPEVYAQKMSEAAELGESWFSVRFSGPEAYQAALNDLFQGEMIWDMLPGRTFFAGEEHVTYSQNDLFYEISVRLAGDDEGDTT